MAISVTQQTEIRRMLGFAMLGQPVSSNPTIASLLSAYRVLDPTSALEVRMNSVTTDEEVQILGMESTAFASYGVAGVVPPGIQWFNQQTGATVYGFVPTIRVLEGDLISGRNFLAFQQAKVVTFRPDELAARKRLLDKIRCDFALYMVVPLDPDLIGGGQGVRSRSTFRRV